MGNKLAARKEVKRAGVPVVPGSDGPVTEHHTARKVAHEVGLSDNHQTGGRWGRYRDVYC